MNAKQLLMILALAVCSPISALAEVKVEPAGMKVVWKSLKEDFDGFQTYNSSEGIYVTFAVRGGDKSIISFDKKKSKASIHDGEKDLGGEFGFWNKTSKDGKTMRIEVKTDELPEGGTSKLKVVGSLNLVLATKTETQSVGPRALKKDDPISFSDDFKCVVKSIEKPKYGDNELEVTLKWDRDIPELAAIRFYDEAGKLIESKAGSWSSMGGFGKRTVSKSYLLKKKSDILKLEVDLWSDAETITVPVDLKVGPSAGK